MIIGIATNPGDLVLDPHLGSGTTAAVAHKMERRYPGIDKSADSFALPNVVCSALWVVTTAAYRANMVGGRRKFSLPGAGLSRLFSSLMPGA
jgi:hypothetical protein